MTKRHPLLRQFPSFLFASLALHALLVTVLAVWTLPTVVDVIVSKILEADPANQPFDDDQRQSHEDGQQAWEKLADLQSAEATVDVTRRETQPINIPSENSRLQPTVSLEAARRLPDDRVLYIPPAEPAEIRESPQLTARAMAQPDGSVDVTEIAEQIVPKEVEALKDADQLAGDELARARLRSPAPQASVEPRLATSTPARPELRQTSNDLPVPAVADEPSVSTRAFSATAELVAEISDESPSHVLPEVERNAVPAELKDEIRLNRGTIAPERFDSQDMRSLVRDTTAGASRSGMAGTGRLRGAAVDVSLTVGPVFGNLNRPRAKATTVFYAVDNVGLREMFTMREGGLREQYIELFGGTVESESAISQGLNWLATHQHPDGSWSLKNFHENCKGKHANCGGAGNVRSKTAATGLALLPFAAAGHTHQSGDYQQQVSAAVTWLVKQQKDNGDLMSAGDQQRLYSHSIAAIALCEIYGMTADPALELVCEESLDFIVKAQHAGTGGWRYEPNQPGDTSVVGWAMMALKSGEMAGLTTPQATLDNVAKWLKRVEGNKPVGGHFGYQNRNATPAMTAEGLLCLQFLRSDRNGPRMRAGADYLLANLPDTDQKRTSYYWYYGTQVMYHMQGHFWEAWNQRLRDHLVQSQIKDGPLAGTWDPQDNWEKRGGRLYTTALKLLMLEVYYRHLPLYQQLDE